MKLYILSMTTSANRKKLPKNSLKDTALNIKMNCKTVKPYSNHYQKEKTCKFASFSYKKVLTFSKLSHIIILSLWTTLHFLSDDMRPYARSIGAFFLFPTFYSTYFFSIFISYLRISKTILFYYGNILP